MTDKQIIKQLADRYKELCRSPFADGYTFTAFEGKCAEKGFTIDDVKNYIEKEKQERKSKRTKSIKSLKEQLKAKEQECEELKNELHKNFEEKDTLHLIIDRLLEASGYDTNTASAEEFEDVYEHMRYEQQQLDQLKAENEELNIINTRLLGRLEVDEIDTSLVFNLDKELRQKEKEFYIAIQKVVKLKKTLTEIKKISENVIKNVSDRCIETTPMYGVHRQIIQKISEVENE